MADRITDAEIQAYIDGQLDMAGRIAVERYLEAHPDAAAAIMEGLRLRDELRLFLADDAWPAPPPTVALARQLARRLSWRAFGLRLRRGLAAAALLAAGWFAHAELGLVVDQVAAAHAPPSYAEEAAQAYEAARLELAAGTVPNRVLLPLTAERTGGVVPMPALPDGLAFLGSDLVRGDGGTGLLALYDAGRGRLVTLFAIEADSFAVAGPQVVTAHGDLTVFWQLGHFAYALNGGLPEPELLAIARRAAATRPWAGIFPLTPSVSGDNHG
ncbi:anti-sigma factor family protein [Benzoatithermus flavus]|uniref:Transmembrane transcriptional regulator (Anti-sigma factor RsiW) n=1 Tax=Benzoatithermus flavus TaxID=3108223 RepID=A0ABU8XRF7_9PROT